MYTATQKQKHKACTVSHMSLLACLQPMLLKAFNSELMALHNLQKQLSSKIGLTLGSLLHVSGNVPSILLLARATMDSCNEI